MKKSTQLGSLVLAVLLVLSSGCAAATAAAPTQAPTPVPPSPLPEPSATSPAPTAEVAPIAVVAIFRLYNLVNYDHLYTTSQDERDSLLQSGEWADEAITGYLATEPSADTTPMFRLFNQLTLEHFYTSDPGERDSLLQNDAWADESAIGHIATSQLPGTTPLYRFFNEATGFHFYTATTSEVGTVLQTGESVDEGIMGYVWISPDLSGSPAPGSQVVLQQPFAIIVAYLGPQTGNSSALFTPLQQAAQKAMEDHGLVHGYGINLVAIDDNCSAAGGEAAAQQVVADERIVAVIGPVCSSSATAALPILEAHGVVMISGSATASGLSAYGPNVFHRTLLDDVQVSSQGYPSQIYIEDLPAVQAWFSDFAAWGGMLLEEGLNHFSPYQYDAMGILLRALDLSSQVVVDGSLVIDREGLRAAVRGTTEYAGVTGSITFEADGDRSP